jgi:putative hydrolase of the HAD superfamily
MEAALVLFDLDNTLADRTAAFGRWAEGFASEHSLDSLAVEWLNDQDRDGFRPRDEFLANARHHFNLDGTLADLLARYDEVYPRCYLRQNTSIAGLRRLRDAGLKVGVVTNGRPSQALKLETTGIGGEVDGFCVSSLVGSRKPERAIFEEAARRCGSALEGWMIGDSAEADIGGGHRVGLRTVWLHRGRTWDRSDLYPDFSAATVSEAVAFILDHPANRGTQQ